MRDSITIQVRGFDPVGRMILSLDGATVELTGLGTDKILRIVPTRTSNTDKDMAGRVTFFDLPPIPWEVKVKLLGYDVLTEIIEPNAAGTLPTGDNDMLLQIQPRALALTLNANDFANVDWLFQNIEVKLEGIPDTNTEGISREETAPGNFTGQARHDERIFRDLIPGRYRATLEGKSDVESFYPLPIFYGTGMIEMTDDILFEGALTTSDGIICQAAPARVRGRVFAADDMMRKDETLSPRYLPKAMTGIRFGEVEGNVAVNLLPQDARFVEFDTDEDGYYSIQIPSTVYGISIPTAEDYWGDHIDWRNETSGGGISQGWPYPTTWPFAFPISPPKGNAVWPSLPLVLQSGDDFVVDIYLHKQRGLFLQQFEEGDTPTRELLLLSAGNSAATNEISLFSDLFSPDVDNNVIDLQAIPVEGGDVIKGSFLKEHFVIFENLPSGTWDFTASHSRFTFNEKQYTFQDWQPPGILPLVSPAPLGLNTGQPLHISSVPNDILQATYNPSTTSLSIKIRSWIESSSMYTDTDPLGFGSTAFAEIPYVKDAIFDSQGRPTPIGPFKFWIPFNGGFWEDSVASEGESKAIELFSGGPSNTPANSTGPSQTFQAFPRALYSADPAVNVPGATFQANGIENPIDGVSKITVTGDLLSLGGITPPTDWLEESEVVSFGGITGTTVTVNITGTYTKRMTAMITLKDAIDDTAISEASVRIRSASGGVLAGAGLTVAPLTHIGNGVFSVTDFSIAPTLSTQECLVEVDAPGYKPFAKRMIPNSTPTPAELNMDVELSRLPVPTITKAEFNRYGLFVPGIKLTGNESAFDNPLPPEQDPFSATWTVMGRSATAFDVTLDTVDGDPLANENNEVTKTITDPVANLYMIDSRSFDGNPSDPDTPIIPSKATDPSRPSSIRGWIRRVETNTLKNVVHQRVNAPSPESPFEAGDMLTLPDLPPGEFQPGFIALTARGAAAFQEIPSYPGAEDVYKLEGASIPRWLSFATNVLTGIAVVDANIAKAAEFVPFGSYTPLDKFTTEVTLDAEHQNFLNYDYIMGTEWTFGIQTPESGFLVFAPGVIGINATAEVSFGSKGFMRELFLQTKGDIQNEPAELKSKRLPALFRTGKDTKFEGQVTFTASNTITRSYDRDSPYELEIKTEIPQTADGKVTGFGFSLTRSINNQVVKVPVIGVKLLLLAKLGVLTHKGTIHGFTGVIADVTFRTPRPPQLPEAGTTQSVDELRANRRHMFGGSVVSASIAPQLGFGAKVTSTVVGEVLQAK